MTTTDKIHTFTRTEFNQMADMGFFEDQRVELLEGEILDMSPQNEPHIRCVSAILRFPNRHLPDSFEVRCQGPYAATDNSQPEPDVYVIHAPSHTGREHPTSALLAIEVADTTLTRDRRKIPIYAAGGVEEYWIVNLPARQIEQYTRPDPARSTYAAPKVLHANDTLACTTLPLPPVAVSQLFPD
jgi:Uma2 family endonuclease